MIVGFVLGCGSNDPDTVPADTSDGTADSTTWVADDDGGTGQNNLSDGSTTSGTADASSATGMSETTADMPGSSGGPETTTGTSTGAPPSAGPYAYCESDDDCDPGLHCAESPNYCSPDCELGGPCPEPPSGDPTPSCAEVNGVAFCRLSCSPDTTTCPAGMYCHDKFPGPPPACRFE